MPSVWVTGDVHGSYDIDKLSGRAWPEGRRLSRQDLLVVCGDFGMPWDGSNEERYWLSWLDGKPWTTLYVDGNHENYGRLADLPVAERWGGRVQAYPDFPNVVHLMRGEVYELGDKRFFCMGGASSQDRRWREPGVSWWEEELPSAEELAAAEKHLDDVGWQVDYVVTHCCSARLQPAATRKAHRGRYPVDRLNEWFDMLEDRLTFDQWFFGHYHADAQLDEKHRLIYRDVVRVV